MKKVSVSGKVHVLVYVLAALVMLFAAYQVYSRYDEQQAMNKELSTLRARYNDLVEKRDALEDEIIDYEEAFTKFDENRQKEHDDLVAAKEQENAAYLASLPEFRSTEGKGAEVCQLFVDLHRGDVDIESQRNIVYQLQRYFSSGDNMAQLLTYTGGGTWEFHEVSNARPVNTVCWTHTADDGTLAAVVFADYYADKGMFAAKRRVLVNYEGFLQSLVADIEPAP